MFLQVPQWIQNNDASGSVPLITTLIAGSDLDSAAQAQTPRLVKVALESGSIISLECLGDVPGSRYLDGKRRDSTIGLAPSFGEVYTGTKWKVDRRQYTWFQLFRR